MKEKVRKEYVRREIIIAKPNCGREWVNRINAVNAWDVCVLRYSAKIFEWFDKVLHDMNIKTRTYLAMFCVFHIQCSAARLYQKRKVCGK